MNRFARTPPLQPNWAASQRPAATEEVLSCGQWEYRPARRLLSFVQGSISLPSDIHNLVVEVVTGKLPALPADKEGTLSKALAKSFPPSLVAKAVSDLKQEAPAGNPAPEKSPSASRKPPAPLKPQFSAPLHASNPPIVAGPWKYAPDTDHIFFDENPVMLPSPRHHVMLATMLSHYPKPVPLKKMVDAIYKNKNGLKNGRDATNSVYMELLDRIESLIPGTSDYLMHRDALGFRISARKGRMSPDDMDSSLLVSAGRWTYDSGREVIFYEKTPLNMKKTAFYTLKAIIERYPHPVPRSELEKTIYDEDSVPLQSRATRSDEDRLKNNIRQAINSVCSNYKISHFPIWFSQPKDSYVFDLKLDEIPADTKEKMDMIECGPIQASLLQGRIWIGEKPLRRLGALNWEILSRLIQLKDRFITPDEMAKEIYGENTPLTKKRILSLVADIKSVFLDPLLPKESGVKLYNHRTFGYILCTSGQAYQNALSIAQSQKLEPTSPGSP